MVSAFPHNLHPLAWDFRPNDLARAVIRLFGAASTGAVRAENCANAELGWSR
jgi:hypothetical protein